MVRKRSIPEGLIFEPLERILWQKSQYQPAVAASVKTRQGLKLEHVGKKK